MKYIIFALIFYFVFCFTVVLGTVWYQPEFKWYEKIYISLLGFVLVPFVLGVRWFDKK